ncbi:hypothetical protein CD178_03259 (plasmid) [Komagataeibacter saccharivorans]|uniref:Uncharacterized protein n=1 Tax=Komagataeibacter saccharivorans TaxID=265959 RepID=A0A347WGL0_9PROT|nr:hypothetical protein CD178_03259 [Komagataeibacter saccharivorans]
MSCCRLRFACINGEGTFGNPVQAAAYAYKNVRFKKLARCLRAG